MKLFFPGVPYSWDATAEAYAAGTPLNIALYTAAEPMHTSKYLERDQKLTPRIKPIQEHCNRTKIKKG
ncbi:MAG: hypothetical protein K6T87_13020, partial [Roseiflexus sp.]|uniref:hypothetical protein n=1 Tax=Roseiflexus sp. TaxID=2562120 RepID=UPI0025FB5F7D